jgi:hypothetical protein
MSDFGRMAASQFVATDNARILVVDDDPILREFAGVYLSTPTMEVEVAEDIFQHFVIPTYVFTGKSSKKRGKKEAYYLYLMQIFTSIKEFNA